MKLQTSVFYLEALQTSRSCLIFRRAEYCKLPTRFKKLEQTRRAVVYNLLSSFSKLNAVIIDPRPFPSKSQGVAECQVTATSCHLPPKDTEPKSVSWESVSWGMLSTLKGKQKGGNSARIDFWEFPSQIVAVHTKTGAAHILG